MFLSYYRTVINIGEKYVVAELVGDVVSVMVSITRKPEIGVYMRRTMFTEDLIGEFDAWAQME